jgi:hypothetical protein
LADLSKICYWPFIDVNPVACSNNKPQRSITILAPNTMIVYEHWRQTTTLREINVTTSKLRQKGYLPHVVKPVF